MYRSINPANGTLLTEFPVITDAALEEQLAQSHRAFQRWRQSSYELRSKVLNAMAALLEDEVSQHAKMLTLEMGKTFASAVAEVHKCAAACRWYAEHGEALLQPESVAIPEGRAQVQYLPLGVVFAIMPWNFPFWQVIRVLAPSLMAGNGVLLKHAPSTPQSALALVDLATRAGLPTGVFASVFADNDQAARVIRDERIAAVTLTGSERAGEAVAAVAGAALKKCVLELGGSDPFIVMPSAELNAAVDAAIFARHQNNGQSCVCAKRFIVHEAIYEQFARAFTAKATALRVGDPLDASTDVGPLATREARDRLHVQVQAALAAGATALTGAAIPESAGAYYSPTILADIPRSSAIAKQEFFGPVAMLFKASSLTDAIDIANDVPFGLGASVWTQDLDEQILCMRTLECGMVSVNRVTASDPRLPFGGVKRSGFGRELGRWGMHEFVNVRTTVFR